MRIVSLMVLFGAVMTACAQEVKQDKAKVEPKVLKVGDVAPPIKGAKYLTGSEIAQYEPSKVYVVEFWATWCGPCIQAMPHLAELNGDFKDQGLVVVGVTTKDPNNSAEKVAEFVEKKGKKFGYAFAYCETEGTYDAFMTASGQQGIPCSFVIDKGGKVAFIGHPSQLDDVIPKVLAGKWRGQADLDEIMAADDEFDAILKGSRKDPADAVKKFEAFAVKYPVRANQEQFIVQKLVVTMLAKKFDDAKAMTEELIKSSIAKKKGNLLGSLSAVWIAPQLNPDKKYPELITTAIDGLIAIDGSTDISAQLHAAEVYSMLEKKDKALEYANTALKMAANDDEKKFVNELIGKIKGDKSPPEKK